MTIQIARIRRSRRFFLMIALLFFGHTSTALTVDEARHLLTRTSFGAAPAEIAALLPLTREKAVDQLLAGLGQPAILPAPYFVTQPKPDYFYVLDPKATNTEALKHIGIQEMQQLRVWWLSEMIATPHPMTERLALLWHQHFTSKYFASFTSALFWDQVQLFRTQGVTSFADLLHSIVHDPLMLIFLDNDVNTRQAPNENLARELLELFTLGAGHYQQTDIKELARILAGHGVDEGRTWRYQVHADALDTGSKTFLGVTGALTLDDAVNIILAQPRTAEFIASKFYREFVDLEPNAAAIAALAKVLRDNNYQLQPFLRSLLLSEAFWQQQQRASLIKSPIELLVGFARSEGVYSPDMEIYNSYAAILGHELFEPDNVEGWRGGTDWLSPQSMGVRHAMLQKLWALRASGVQYLQHQQEGGLWIRYSAEYRGVLGSIEVMVNGKTIGHIKPTQATRIDDEGHSSLPMRPKPVWELAYFAPTQLPKNIRTLRLIFHDSEHIGTDHDTNVFINWVEWHGERLPAYLASQQRYQPSCGANTEQVPRGMLYCDGYLEFRLNRAHQAGNANWQDRRAPLNSIIEGGTTRLPYLVLPAGRAKHDIQPDIQADWRQAGLPWQAANIAAATLADGAPIQTNEDLAGLLKNLTLDARYNLK